MRELDSIDLRVLLPEEVDDDDGCVRRLAAMVGGAPGVTEAHVVRADGAALLCVHYDASLTSVARIRSLAHASGAELAGRYGHVVWPVSGVGHARRARAVKAALVAVPGVLEAEVTAAGVVRIEWDRDVVGEASLAALLESHGLRRRDVTERGAMEEHRHDGDGEHSHGHGGVFGERTEVVFAGLAAGLVVGGQLVERLVAGGDGAATLLYVAAFAVAGWFTAREAIENVRERRFEIDALMLVAAAGAAVLGQWFEGALLLVLFALGHALEGFALGRARQAIEALAEIAPTTAWIRDGDDVVEVPVGSVTIGDVVVVRPNERFPVDGFVIVGTTTANQAPVTGESLPVDKAPVLDAAVAAASPERVDAASRIFAGSLNGTGAVEVQVTRPGGDSTLAQVARMVAEAETEVAPTQRLTERFERVFVPVVITLAVGVALLGPLVTSWSWSTGFYRSMAVLVAASPCALAIATPSAVLSAIARAAGSRVLVKGGAALEQLGGLRAMAFDKTGTLTEGRPRIADVRPTVASSETELLMVALAVERLSDHPLARAITADAGARLPNVALASASGLVAIVGRGVTATLDGVVVHIGSRELFAEVSGPALRAGLGVEIDQRHAAGRTTMVVRHGERSLGLIGLMDTPRGNAGSLMCSLRSPVSVTLVMLSGDAAVVAAPVAAQVGVDEGIGDLLPEDKVAQLRKLKEQHGSIAMVGDGVNDAPALAAATVGIAMGAAGSDVALETADVALMADELEMIPFVIRLSRATRHVIRQNLYLSLGVVAVLVPLTIAGLNIGPAVIAHEGSTLVVVANALRLLAFDRNSWRVA